MTTPITTPAKPFDKFNKRLFQELLSPYGQVFPNLAVLGEERFIDIFFVPNAATPLDELALGGLTGIASRPALIEPFRSALQDADVRTCLMKLFMVEADQAREHPTIELDAPANLWILAAEVSDRLLQDFKGEIDPTYGDGYYLLAKGLGTTVVAIAQLPAVPETLWLRLLGKGDTQERAIAELLELPDRDPKRESALNLLVAWRINMEIVEEIQREEREIQMALSQAYLEWEKQTERRGREQGREEERESTIRNLMQLRYGRIDEPLEALLPQLLALSNENYTRLLLELSKDDLIAHFA
jgi:hypothetical protein